jgi:hypothetical protein
MVGAQTAPDICIGVQITPKTDNIDQAGGLAAGLVKELSNYFPEFDFTEKPGKTCTTFEVIVETYSSEPWQFKLRFRHAGPQGQFMGAGEGSFEFTGPKRLFDGLAASFCLSS